MAEDSKSPDPTEYEPKAKSQVDTGGAAYVGGDVDTGGGDFIGRDLIPEETTYVVHGLRNPYLGLRSVTFAGRDKKSKFKKLKKQEQENLKWMNRMTPKRQVHKNLYVKTSQE